MKYLKSLPLLIREETFIIFYYWPRFFDLAFFNIKNRTGKLLFDVADIPYLQAKHFGVPACNEQAIKKHFESLIGVSGTLFFITPTLAKLLNSKVLRKKRTLIVPNASNPGFFSPTPLSKNSRRILLCVSGYAPMRGIELLSRAFEKIDGNTALLKLVGHNMPLKFSSEHVIVERRKFYRDMPQVYSNSYACVVPHRKNAYMDAALPLKLFDAMAAARPVVVTDCYEMSKLVREEKCGIVTEDNHTSLAEGIEYLLSNPRIAEEMGMKGREAVEKRHSWFHRADLIKRNL